jgi:glycosyltransferase involved in cell wall biosynthesis
VRFVPHLAPSRIPGVVAAASALVLPSSGATAIGRIYTSPMKLFEYMASGRPIVASDLPSLREVLAHEHNALLAPADDAEALAAALRRLLADPVLSSRLADRALADVEHYTWRGRTAGILNFLGGLPQIHRMSTSDDRT